MKRVGLILGEIAILLLAVAVITPWMTPEPTIRKAVMREIEALTGRVPTIAGSARLTLLPYPAITVRHLSVPGPAGQPPFLEAEAVEGTLRLPALLLGRLELSSVALRRPRLALRTDADGRRSWAFSSGLLADAAAGRDVARLPLGSLRMIEGTVDYADAKSGRSASVRLDDATVHWSSMGDALSASGVVGWRGQTLDLALSVADPASLLSGRKSDIRGRLSCDLFKITGNGSISGDGRFEGKVAAASASLRNVLRWVGLGIGEGAGLEDFKLQSPATIDGRGMAFQAVQVELDGNSAEGVLALKLDAARPKLTGTLDAETIDMTPYGRELEIVEGPMRRWRDDPLTLDALDLGELDLRLSSGETIFGHARLGRMAAGAVSRDGALELSIGEAVAYGGTVNGRIILLRKDDGPRLTASVDFESVDMANALGDAFAFRKLEGVGRGTIRVAASGGSIDDLLHSLTGEARFSVASGALIGIDLVEVMRRIEKRPLSIGYEPRSGRTAFERAVASFAVEDGVARTSDARLDGQALSVVVGGNAGVAARNFDLTGEAVLAPGEDAVEPFRLPFKIMGSWEWPVVEPDPDALIRRSGAAAPLLKHGARAFTAEGAAKPAPSPAISSHTLTP